MLCSLDALDQYQATTFLGFAMACIHSMEVPFIQDEFDSEQLFCCESIEEISLACTNHDACYEHQFCVSFQSSLSAKTWCESNLLTGSVWQAQDPLHLWSSSAGHVLCCDSFPLKLMLEREISSSSASFCKWYPFVSFLRWRRTTAKAHHKKVLCKISVCSR